MRNVIRLKQYSLSTEETYVGWYRRYVRRHEMEHPKEMGAAEVEAFLAHLAVNLSLSAVSQNQALNALLFIYKEVLKVELEGIDSKRAKHTKRLPVESASRQATAGRHHSQCRFNFTVQRGRHQNLEAI